MLKTEGISEQNSKWKTTTPCILDFASNFSLSFLSRTSEIIHYIHPRLRSFNKLWKLKCPGQRECILVLPDWTVEHNQKVKYRVGFNKWKKVQEQIWLLNTKKSMPKKRYSNRFHISQVWVFQGHRNVVDPSDPVLLYVQCTSVLNSQPLFFTSGKQDHFDATWCNMSLLKKRTIMDFFLRNFL